MQKLFLVDFVSPATAATAAASRVCDTQVHGLLQRDLCILQLHACKHVSIVIKLARKAGVQTLLQVNLDTLIGRYGEPCVSAPVGFMDAICKYKVIHGLVSALLLQVML